MREINRPFFLRPATPPREGGDAPLHLELFKKAQKLDKL
jgi:hypothetical protein